MNKLVLILLITSTSFGQSFTKLDVLKFKDLTKVEALMYKKGMRNTSTNTNYWYEERFRDLNSDNPQCKPKRCEWYCEKVGRSIDAKYPIQELDYEYYHLTKTESSEFAFNYNSNTSSATTFVDVSYRVTSYNTNCDKQMKLGSSFLNIEFQFNDMNDFDFFKNNIMRFANYVKTAKEPWEDGRQIAQYEYFTSTFERSNTHNYANKISFHVSQDNNSGYIEIFIN
jgi:hypothetical protein